MLDFNTQLGEFGRMKSPRHPARHHEQVKDTLQASGFSEDAAIALLSLDADQFQKPPNPNQWEIIIPLNLIPNQ